MATAALSYANLLPGRNPGGNTTGAVPNIAPSTGSTSGANPMLAPPNIPAGSPQSNPYATSTVPTTPTTPAVPTSTTGLPYQTTSLTSSSPTPTTSLQSAQSGPFGSLFSGMTQKGWDDFLHELDKTYGEGTGSMLANFIAGGAGFNQQAVNNLFASLQPGIEQGQESLMEQYSAMGDRFGSDSSLALSNFESGVTLDEGQIETQMYENSLNNLMSVLTGAGGANASRIASSPSTSDTIGGILGTVGNVAGGINTQGFTGTGTLSSILDTVASIGGAFV